MPGSTQLRRLVGVVLAAGLASLSGCASSTGGLSGDPADYGSPSAEVAVTRFLEAADQEDYQAMSRQFGTREGPAEARLGVAEVEQRMMVLGGLLGHDELGLERQDLARTGPHRVRYVATMQGTRNGTVELPVVAVQAREGRWFVEQLEMDPLTREN